MDYLFKIILILILPKLIVAQQVINLKQAIDLGKKNSRELELLNAELSVKQKELLFFKSSIKPQIKIGGSLPNFTRIVAPVILPDGKEIFVYRSLTFSRIGLESSFETSRMGTITVQSAIQKLNDFAIFPFAIGYQLPLPLSRKNFYQQKLLETEINLHNATVQKTELKIESEVGNLYVDYLLKAEEINLLEGSLNELLRLFEIQKNLLKNGFETLSDLSNIEISIDQLKIQLLFAQNDLKKFKLYLAEKIQIREFKIEGWETIDFNNIPNELNPPEEIYSIEKEYLEVNTSMKKRLAALEWGPIIGIHLTIGLNNSNSNLQDLLKRMQGQQTAGINFSIPIFNSGLRNKRIELINLENRVQNLKLEWDYQNIQIRWMELHNLYQTIQKSINILDQSLQSTEINYQKKYQSYQLGEISWMELNQALYLRNSMKNEKLGLQSNLLKIYFELQQLEWTPK